MGEKGVKVYNLESMDRIVRVIMFRLKLKT